MKIKSFLNPITWSYEVNNKQAKDLVYLDIGCRSSDKILNISDISFKKYIGVDADENEIIRLVNKYKKRKDLEFINCGIHDTKQKKIWFNVEEDIYTSYTSEIKGKNSKPIKTDTIDNIVKKKKINHVDILNIDIEGNSGLALKGCKKTLERGLVEVIECELLPHDVNEFKTIFSEIVKADYKLFSVNQTSRYLSKGIKNKKPVPIIFDLIFIKSKSNDRQKYILHHLGYDTVLEKEKTWFLEKVASVLFDFISHFLKKIYPRAFYRTIETDTKTLFRK
tara:strand:- start:175 stop:1011 length:837 start_codon:yes stop_codon:yes gene_type:complete